MEQECKNKSLHLVFFFFFSTTKFEDPGSKKAVIEHSVGENGKGIDKHDEADALLHNTRSHNQDLY